MTNVQQVKSQITVETLSHGASPAGTMKLSIVIPVYNEHTFIEEVLLRVQAVQFDKEIIVIDDGSTDGTRALLQEFARAQAENQSHVVVLNGQALLSLQNIHFLFPGPESGERCGFASGISGRYWRRRPGSRCRPGVQPARLPQAAGTHV